MSFLKKGVILIFNFLSKRNDALLIDQEILTEMEIAQKTWYDMYLDNSEWLSNGVKSMNLASSIASEIARLTCLEMRVKVQGTSERAKYLQEQLNEFLNGARQSVEFSAALGGVIFKPFVFGNKIFVETIKPKHFTNLSFDVANNLVKCVVIETILQGKYYYSRFETHIFNIDTKQETIVNEVFKSKGLNDKGQRGKLTEVDEWANLQEEIVINNVEEPMLTYFKMPYANSIDPNSKLGVSIYSRAVELIKEADIQYSRYLWEYEAGEAAINVDQIALKNTNNNMQVAKLNNRLYRAVDIPNLFDMWTPSLRDESYYRGLNNILKKIEFLCSISYGTLSDPQQVELTATQIISSKQRSFSTVKEVQKSFEEAIKRVTKSIDLLATLYELAPEGEYSLSFNWDDSIIMDKEKERNLFLSEIASGVRNAWEYRVKFLGEEEEIAKANIKELGITFEDS